MKNILTALGLAACGIFIYCYIAAFEQSTNGEIRLPWVVMSLKKSLSGVGSSLFCDA